MRQALILAGGMGTRLKERLGGLPKPLIPIGGKPLIEHQVALASQCGFSQVIVLACYRADLIQECLGDGSRWNIKITYQIEREPMGTAGAVLEALPTLADRFLVIYGDTFLNIDLNRFWDFHLERKAVATLFLHPNNHPFDSDLVEMDSTAKITAFHNRPHAPEAVFQNLVNAGLYVIERSCLENLPRPVPQPDFGRDLFPALLAKGVNVAGYHSPEYIKDIGTPQRYDLVCEDFARGIVQESTLTVPQKAVFLDRDGTLVKETDGLRSAGQLEVLDGVAAALHDLNQSGYRAVVVTNQPVIAKGWCSEIELERIHRKLETLLGRQGAFLDRIYYCPHHPEAGFPGERKELKIACDCRKPGTGMIEMARRDLNIDLQKSWLIGDSSTDIQTARNAGLKSVLVRTGHAGRDGKYSVQPDFTVDTLGEAIKLILK